MFAYFLFFFLDKQSVNVDEFVLYVTVPK